MNNIVHKDVLGQPIEVGSTVLYGSGGGRSNYAGFRPSKVLKSTTKMIRIEYQAGNFSPSERVVDPKHCVVIDKLLPPKSNDERYDENDEYESGC